MMLDRGSELRPLLIYHHCHDNNLAAGDDLPCSYVHMEHNLKL